MIRVSATPSTLDVTPAYPVDLTLAVRNDGTAARTVTLRLVGLDPAWVQWPESLPVADGAAGPAVSLEAGESIDIPIRVTLPPGFPAGAQLIGIEAADGVARPALGSLQLSVADIDGVSLGMSPASFRGGRTGRFRLNVVNRGRRPIDLSLSGRPAGDDEASLKFTFKPNAFTLRPDERVRVRGTVTGKRPIVGAPRIRPMTIVAQSNSAPLHADARFTQRPLLSRRVLRVVGVFVALSMWAGALVTAVRWTGDRREETAAEASTETDTTTTTVPMGDPVEVDTDGDGIPDTTMVDTDGDGVPDTELVDTDGDGVPDSPKPPGEDGLPSGPVLSGQVTGVADRSNITVTGRYVQLASAVSTDAGDDVTAQGIGDGRKGKLYASGVTTVDTDDPAKAERSTVTDEQGFWKLAGLAEGNWELTFTKEGFATKTLVVPVEKGVEPPAIEVAMAAGTGSVGGTALTADGPLGGATVTVTDGKLVFTTTTPTEGNVGQWQLGGLSTPGSYLVSVAKRGYGTQTASVTLAPSGSKLDVNLTLVAGVGSISGSITNAATGDGIGGITVTAESETVTRSVTTLTDDPVGAYLLPQLPIPGDYTLTITGTNFVPQTQLVSLTDNATGVDFELQSTTATIVGEVSGPDGPLEAVGVTVSQDEPLVKTLSAADPPGSFEVTSLQPGTYTVTFERFGYKTQSTIVELAVGAIERVEMTLEETPDDEKAGDATVQGIVRDGTTGQPITGVSVAFQGKTVTSAEGGTFTLTGLAAGTGDLALTHSKHQATSRTVRLGVKATVQVDITMLPLAGLQGQVTDITATPIEGVTVSVAAQTGTAAVTGATATTDANGEYSIPQAFPTGSYIATFSKSGYGTQTREFDATAGSNSTADIQLVELGTIAGAIQEPAAGLSGGFTPVVDADVVVERMEGGVAVETVFDEKVTGRFDVTGLQPGTYRVRASKLPTHPESSRLIEDLKLREVRDGGVVLSATGGSVSGQVFYLDQNNNRVPVEGALVETNIITGFNTLPIFPFIQPIVVEADDTTDVNGNYSFDDVVSGSTANYTVTASGFTTRIVSITAPTTSGSGDILLTPLPRDIEGTATVDPDDPSVEITVSLSSTAAGFTPPVNQTIDADGVDTYTFADLQPGTYTVTFTATGYHTTTESITIPPGPGSTALPVDPAVLEEHSDLRVQVRENGVGGDPVVGATVTLTATGREAETQTTGALGIVDFDALFSDPYTITITRTGYQTYTAVESLDPGESETHTAAFLRLTTAIVDVTSDLTTGGVLDSDPLEGATVTATPTGGGSVVSLTPVTGTPGRYRAIGLADGTYTGSITASGHDSGSFSITAAAGTDSTQTVNMQRYGDLTVHVVEMAGGVSAPLEGATVTATPSTGGSPLTLTAVAGTPGDYRATGVAPATYAVQASKSGYQMPSSQNVTAVAGTTPSSPTFTLNKYGTLIVNLSSRLDGVDTPLSGATVTATPSGGAPIPLTPQDGNPTSYEIPNVLAGSYTISASASGHTSRSAVSTVGAGDDTEVDFWLLAHPTIEVTVTSDVDGTPITNATVTATATGQGTISFTHTVNGVYEATGVTPSVLYTITASAAGHTFDTGTPVTTTPAPGAVDSDQEIELIAHRSLTVLVQSRVNGVDTLVDGATVTVAPTAGGSSSPLVGTGNLGEYRIDSIAPLVEYTVTATLANHQSDTATITPALGTDAALNVGDLVLGRYVSLSVEVLENTGSLGPSVGATVTATSGGTPITLTDPEDDGTYSASDVPPGTYTISATKTGFGNGQTTGVVVGAGGADVVAADITLAAESTISVNVDGLPGGADLDDVSIVLRVIGSNTTTRQRFTGDDGSGLAVFRELAAATPAIQYRLTLSKPGYETKTIDVSLETGESEIVNTTLARLSFVTIDLRSSLDGATSALAGATVTATQAATATTPQLTVSAVPLGSGAYLFPWLTSGSWDITASAPDHTTSTQALATLAGGSVVAAGTDQTATFDLLRNPTQTVTVTRDPGGATVSGALVTARPTAGAGAAFILTETATGGTYRSAALTPGTTYELTASKEGFTLEAAVTTAAVAAGTSLANQALVLLENPTLTVDVTSGFTGSLTDENDATVTLTPTAGDGAAVTLTRTANDGEYVSPRLVDGTTYTLSATLADHTLDEEIEDIVVEAGEALADEALVLLRHPTQTIEVERRANDDTDPLSGATVTATRPGGPSYVLSESATVPGTYETPPLQPGAAYTITASNGTDVLVTTRTTAAVAAGTELDPIESPTALLLQALPSLTVTVVGGFDDPAPADPTPAGGSDATVTAIPTDGGEPIVLAETSTAGTYAAPSVPVGTYDLRVTKAGHADSLLSDAFTSELGGANGSVGPRTLLQYPDVTVDVTDLNDDAVSNALVTLTPATSGGSPIVLGESGTTAGRYVTTAVPAVTGGYRLRIEKAGFNVIDVALSITAGTAIPDPIEHQLLPHPMVSISVTSSGGGDLSDATVTARNTATGEVSAMAYIGGGIYRAQLAPASYEFRAIAPNHGEDAETFPVPADDPDGLVTATALVLPRFGTITVDVESSFDGDEDPLTGATVIATEATSGLQYLVPDADNDGTHVLADVPTGSYTVAATAPGHDGSSAAAQAVSTAANGTYTLTLLKHPDLTVNVLGGLAGGPPDAAGGSGATVTLTPLDASGPTITIIEVDGDPGVHTLSPVPPGEYRVTASKAGHLEASEDIEVEAGLPLDDVDLTLLTNPDVTVAVENAGGEEISDAVVTLVLDGSGAVTGLPETATDGTYTGTGVVPGDYTLYVQAAGYTTYVDEAITVVPGVPLDIGTVELAAAASLTVTVNSVLDGDSAGLDGATVVATNDGTGQAFVLAQVLGGAPGDYATSNLPAGSYTVQATAPGHEGADEVVAENPLVAGEEGTATIDLPRYPTLTVEVLEEDGDGDPDTEVALSGATVTAQPVGGGAVLTLAETADPGVYEVTGVTPGVAYDVTATKAGYTSDAGTTAVTAAGTNPAAVELTLVDATVVTVTVKSAVTLGGTTSLLDLTTATVTLELEAGGGELELIHQHDGIYQRTVSVTGEYVIKVEADGHTSVTDDNGTANFDLTLGAADVTRTVELPAEPGTISGTVTGLGGPTDPLQDVTVSARNGATVVDAAAPTDADGDYSITGLAPGVWSVTFEGEDLAPLTIAVVTVPFGSDPDQGATVDLDVTLAPEGGAIMGQFLGKASAEDVSAGNPATPLDGVTVTLEKGGTPIRPAVTTSAATGAWFGFGSLDVDDDYQLVLTNVPAGYTGSTTIDVDVTSGGIVIVSHTLVAPTKQVIVTAQLADGTPVPGVVFRLVNPALDADPIDSDASDGDGDAVFDEVPYGTWTMTVQTTPAGYASLEDSARVIIVDQSTATTSLNHAFAAIGTVSGEVIANDTLAYLDDDANYTDGGVEGAVVQLTNANGYSAQVIAANDGTYTFTNVPATSGYTLTFTHDDYVTDVITGITVTPDSNLAAAAGDTVVDGLMDRLASFTIEVKDDQNNDLNGATVGLFRDTAETTPVLDYFGNNPVSAIDGNTFVVSNLDPTVGDVSLHIRGDVAGHTQISDATIDLTAGENAEEVLTLARNATVNVSVNGLLDGESTATVTLEWTTPFDGDDDFTTPTFDDDATGPEAVSVAPVTGVTATINVTGDADCAIDASGDLDASPFDLLAGTTQSLVFACDDS